MRGRRRVREEGREKAGSEKGGGVRGGGRLKGDARTRFGQEACGGGSNELQN